MQDPVTGSKLVTINLPDGSERNLKKCSPSDWIRLANIFRANRKAAKKASMLGAPPADLLAELDKLDKAPVKEPDLLQWLNSLEGQHAAILLSLAKEFPDAGPDALAEKFDELGLEPFRWLEVAAKLFNIPLEPVNAKKNDEGGATTNPTGGEPPTSSAPPSTPPTTP